MKNVVFGIIALALLGISATATPVQWEPEKPSHRDTVAISLHDFTPGDILHWGVNFDGISWVRPIAAYRPPESSLHGDAVRTSFTADPDDPTTGHVKLGPFDDTNQVVGAVVFAISRADGTWDNNRGEDYYFPVTAGRIFVQPEHPTVNDIIRVTIQDSFPNGMLRWGVNEEREIWTQVHPVYHPEGTILADDGAGVDTPISEPDETGESVVYLGPFNRGEQVVKSLHMAVHWDDKWDTDGGRNYNVTVQWRDPDDPHAIRITHPAAEETVEDSVTVTVDAPHMDEVELWLSGELMDVLTGPPFTYELDMEDPPFGPHQLTARAVHDGKVQFDQRLFWHVPEIKIAPMPEGVGYGATEHEDGTVTFALYAPGKKFISLVGDFNDWDPEADRMHRAPDGSWWITRALEPGTHLYQYNIEGARRLGDPYARQVYWINEHWQKGWKPHHARTVLEVGAEPFEWTATDYQRPSLDELVIYELYIHDLAPNEGFEGVIDRLDYIADLGFNAVEPLPWHPWPGLESWGYNPAFHFAVEQLYGTPNDLKRLIDEAHKRGMAVIIDMVLNHMEWGSPLYQLYGNDYEASPYFREYHGHNWGFPKIDQESPAVKRYVADVIRFWIEEYRIDGFRYDATRWTGWQGYNDWGASWYAYVARNADPDNIQIAEHLPVEPPLITETEMDTSWHAGYRWRIREMITRAELYPDVFADVMDGRRVGFENSLQRMPYTESHDEERVVRELREAGFDEEEVFRRAAMAMALPLTTPGVPMIYAGQEFGEFKKKVVGWNPLSWYLLAREENRGLLDITRALVHLRVSHPALREDNLRILVADRETGLALFQRDSAPHVVQVAAHFGRQPAGLSVHLHEQAEWKDVLNGQPHDAGVLDITLQPGEVRVWATVVERD